MLRGAGGQAFVAGTDIGQFPAFEGAADGLAYERDGDRRIGRLEAVRKPVIAQIQGFAVGAGLRIAAACDLRIATPDARFGAPIARTLGNCLSADAYARLVDLVGPSRVTALLFTARLLGAQERPGGRPRPRDRGAGGHRRARPGPRRGGGRARPHHAPGHQGSDSPPPGGTPRAGHRRPDRRDVRQRGLSRRRPRVPGQAHTSMERPMTTPTSAHTTPPPHETYATRFGLRPVALGRRGMVASANPLATLAGLRMLARGGNAVDALVATAAAIGVAEPYMSGLAGCGVLVLTRPGHRPRVLNFLGRAPSGVSRERLHGANHTSGPSSVAVPGNLAGWAPRPGRSRHAVARATCWSRRSSWPRPARRSRASTARCSTST